MNYAVVFIYSFDPSTVVYLFRTEKEAVAFLRDNYETELKISSASDMCNIECEISSDGWFARITEIFDDGDEPLDVTEMRVAPIFR